MHQIFNLGRHNDLYTREMHTVRWEWRLLGGHAKLEEVVAELMAALLGNTRLESRVVVIWRASFSLILELHGER